MTSASVHGDPDWTVPVLLHCADDGWQSGDPYARRTAHFATTSQYVRCRQVTLTRPLEAHEHATHLLIFVLAGAGHHEDAGGRIPLLAGDVCIVSPSQWHAYPRVQGILTLFTIAVLPSYLAACAPLLGDVPWLAVDSVLDARALSGASRPAHMRLSPFDLTRMRPLLAALADEVGEPAPSSRPGVRAGLLLHILGLLDRGSRTVRKTLNAANDGGDDRIITAIRYLEECYVGPISIEDLARQSGYTPTSFTRKFHQRVGLSPSDYLLNLRIQHACALLQHTSLSISSISSAVGFSDRHYFATRFRQVMGVTPSAFRVRPKTDSHTA